MNTTTKTRVSRLAPAALIAAVALVGAGTGSAVAAKMITGADIKNNTVASADLKNNNVASADLKNGGVKEKDLAAGVKSKLNTTLPGYEVKFETVEMPTTAQGSVHVACTPGKIAIAGGGNWEDVAVTDTSAVIQESHPSKQIGEFFADLEAGDVPTAWTVTGQANNLDPVDLTAYVICVNP